jgi:hypothetical protein
LHDIISFDRGRGQLVKVKGANYRFLHMVGFLPYKLASSLSKVKLLTTVSAGAFVFIKDRFLFTFYIIQVLIHENALAYIILS